MYKHYLTILLCFLTSFVFAQPANDNCSGAQNLGNLPTPAACPSGIGTSVNVTGTTIGATPTNPYNYLLGCQTGGNQPAPANDVWYRFVATSNQVNINITGGSPALSNPAITLWTGNCGNLSGFGCDNNGTAGGSNNAVFEPLTPGQTYYIQISGSTTTATGNFNLSVNAQNDCSDCLQGSYLTTTPAPTNGTYPPNTQVTFCYTITSFNQVSANWLHGVIPTFGAGWNPSTLQSVSAPNASAGYIWVWTNGPQGLGWYVDYDPVGPTGPDGNVTNNYGTSNINGTGTWTFCWRITTDPNCSAGTDLSVDVNTTSDGETGNWTSVACTDDPVYQFSSTLICCTNPTVTLSNQTICQGQSVTLTPTVSPGGGTYSWSSGQATSSITVTPSTTTSYTVTYATGSCFSTATSTVTVNPQTVPTFTQLGPFCSGTNFTLPTTSNNGITGSWSPAINNTSTTTYTFTPTAGQCATTTTMTVTINPSVTPTFTQLGPFCSGTNFTLPTTSNNGITGSWSPSINNTTTTTYTFTPTAGQCASTTTMTVTINALITPTFTQLGPFCSGTNFTLPTTSNNGISGTWSPAINNTTTTTYTFTPTAGQCATTVTMTVVINPQTVPSFTQLGPFCSGTNFTLPTTSTNGITGSWSPSINNTTTTSYTFTPTAGQCASTTTMTVTINSQTVPNFTQLGPFCYGSNFTLPTTSNNGISGTWSPAINNTATTTYTFTPTAGQCATTTTMLITITPQSTTPTLACYETATWNSTTCQWIITGTQPPAPTGLLCYQTSTWNPVTCVWDITGTQPPAPTGLACYETATWNPVTCQWVITGTQPPAPTGLLCYQTSTWNPTTCIWDISGTQPPAPTGLLCYQTATWNSVTCVWDISGTQPPAPSGLACYETATWNTTTCQWNVTGTQPPAPTGLLCYQTSTWNPVTCVWDISGTQPPAPTGLLCYQTSTWNSTTCVWDISGTQPPAPTGLLCYQTATWNPATCQWDISGTQPPAPTGLLCYQTATWNPVTCVWDVTGTQPPAPTGLACYETAAWNSVTCQWDVTGNQPPAPTGLLCYQTATWNGTTCVWDISGTQPPAPTGLLCYQTSNWNSVTCQWDITGTQPPAPTGLLCYETATWDPVTCVWDISGTQPPAPTGLLCYETATWNPVTCVWDISGTQPPAPTSLLCYQTATWNSVTCVWDITGTQPPAPTGLACYETSTWNSVTCVWDISGTQPPAPTSLLCYQTATWNSVTCVWDITGTQPPAPTGLACYETSTWNSVTCVWDISGTQPPAPTGLLCYETATWNSVTCVWDITGTQPPAPTGLLCYQTATWNSTTCVWDISGTQPPAPTGLACYETATWNPVTCVWDISGTQPPAPTGLACYETATWNSTTCIWDISGTQPPAPTGLLCYQTATWNSTTCVWDISGTQPPAPTGLACYETSTWNSITCQWDISGTPPSVSLSSNPNTINILGSSVLTAIGSPVGGTYTWSPASSLNTNTGSSVTATPNTTTTYTVVYDIGNNCTATATTTITVNALTLSVNSTTICSGSSTTLTATPSVIGGSYLWSPGGQTTQSITVSPNTNSIYTCVYTLNGVSTTPTIGTVTVYQTPVVTVTNPTICSGSSSPITATGAPSGGSYVWSNSATTSTINVSPVTTTSYTVTYTSNGCTATATGTVTVNQTPTISVSSSTICSGQSSTVTATPSSSGGLFMWNNSQTTPSITVSPTATTTYSVMYTLNGCPVTGTGTVTVNPIPTVSVSSSTICLGSSATLTATPSIIGGTYSWSSSSSTSNTITVSPNSTTSYSVTYTLNGCSSQSASGTVTVNPIPTVNVNSVVICSNESATLTATPSSAGGTYLWSPNGETTNSITVSPVSTSSYSVVYSLNGCQSSSSSGTVTVNPLPVVSFIADQLIGCAPLTVQLTNTGSTNGTYSWSINGQNVIGSSIEYTFLQEGCYDIALTTTENGCVNTASIEDYICVENPPVASFVANPDIFTEPSQIISFSNNTIGGVSYYWNFGDGNSSIDYEPIHTFSNTLNGYTITLTATSQLGCVDTYQITIEYQEDLVFYVPNTFTPDGNEFNNVFQPVFTSGFDANNYQLTIFNRWGEVIFESYDATKGWDGFYNGRLCQDGVYNWKIIFKIPDTDERKIVTGHVVLIR